MNTSNIHDISFRRAAFFAAVGLLGMSMLAPIALYVGFENLVTPDDAALTMSILGESQHLFRGFIVAFLVVAVLDVVVAWSLFIVFTPVSRDLSLLAAWLRITYAAILAMSLVNSECDRRGSENDTGGGGGYSLSMLVFVLMLSSF